MKHLKYIFALLLTIVFVSCTKDAVDQPVVADMQLRDALLKSDAIGVYQNGAAEYLFDKNNHQLYIAPSQYIIRIQDDEGVKSVELRMSGMPTIEQSIKASLAVNGIELTGGKVEEVLLLKSESNKLWIWSSSTKTGFIMPWISE